MSFQDRRQQARLRRFQPTLDGGRLEARQLLSNSPRSPFLHANSPAATASAGASVVLTTNSGEQFYVHVSGGGTVRGFKTPGGAFRLLVQGTDSNSELTINPLLQRPYKGTAHTFSPGKTTRNSLVTISGINVTSGRISSILGYHTTILSGPISVGDATPIDRIALFATLPGASIGSGGDVNTLDIYSDAIFSGKGTGISVGRDVNYMSVGGSLGLFNGANLRVGRDIGLVGQPIKGTEIGIDPTNNTTNTILVQGGLIQGNLVIGSTSKFIVGRSLDSRFLVRGTVFGVTPTDTSRLSIPSGGGNFVALGGGAPFNGA